jgi:acyl carrier protein
MTLQQKEQGMSIEQEIKGRIIEQLRLDVKDVAREASFRELGADSLDLAELLMSFEQDFNIRIPPESAEKLRTVGSAIDFIVAATAQ